MKNKKFKVEFWLTKEEINLVINLLENREEEIWKEVLGKGKCKQNDTDIEADVKNKVRNCENKIEFFNRTWF